MALKNNRLMIAALALVAMAILAACASSPSPTATPLPTPTVTPVPVQPITADSNVDPAGFLAELPSAEVDCATSAVGGRDKLISLVSLSDDGAAGISNSQLNVLASCISNDTVERIVVGQLEVETGGLSPATSTCVTQYTDGINFASLFSGKADGQDTIVSTLQALFCLTPGERRALETSDQSLIDLTQLGGIDALECAVDGAGTDGLAAFGDIFDSEGVANPLAVGEFMPLLIDCGVVDDDSFQSNGITTEQFSCLFRELDPESLARFTALVSDPSATLDLTIGASLLNAMNTCGLDLQELINSNGSAGFDPGGTGTGGLGLPSISPDLLVCLVGNGVSATVASNYASGTTDTSDPALTAALALCEGEMEGSVGSGTGGIVVPDGSGGTTSIDPSVFDTLPITAEQAECLVAEMGAEQLEGIATGTVSPLTALAALGACNISLSDLIAG